MAIDATGPPTALGIPKYNPNVDAPSGLGFNAAMDSIDALIAARVPSPTGVASGEVPVWNGTAWVRSSVTRIGPSSLGSGAPDAATFLRGDGAWAGSWTSYTPAWTSSGTAPVLGNGTAVGRYMQVGKLAVVNIEVTFGSTSTFGTGPWFFSLPLADASVGFSAHGSAFLQDAGVTFYEAVSRLEAGGQKMSLWKNNAFVSAGAPFVWGSGDIVQATLMYQVV